VCTGSSRSSDWLKNPMRLRSRREVEEDWGVTPRSQPGSRNANILPLLDSLGAERAVRRSRGLVMSALDDLTRKLRLSQTASKDAAKKWVKRTRALAEAGMKWDQAGPTAAKELFPAEFFPTRYRSDGPSTEALVEALENLQ
jgi:hypothetical protein